mgnify:CR=1 FL=1
MKEKKQIHTGLCITDDRIVATTAPVSYTHLTLPTTPYV